MAVELQKHQPSAVPTQRDLVRVQENVAAALGLIQLRSLEFIGQAPATSNAPGKRGQAYLSTDGVLYLCCADGSWAKFQGVTFP